MLSAIERGKTLDEAADRLAQLEPRDAAFARAIVMVCLRHRGQIYDIMDQMIAKPIPPRPHLARALVQVGLAQLCFMGVAPHAALHETVNAIGRQEAPYRGLLNAVLRRVSREAPTSGAANLPAWMLERWSQNFGSDRAHAMANIFTQTPPLDLCFPNTQEATLWAEKMAGICLGPHHVRLKESGPIDALPDYAAGTWWVQDLGAQIPATLFSKTGSTLDLCAAPGGKSLQLAHAGHDVTALDISASRLARLKENLARCHAHITCVEADLLQWSPEQEWENVLLDAPCSASGTLRRHPDIALHRREADSSKRAALQREMLERALKLTANGGTLIYCVCSLEKEEGEDIAQAFTQDHDGVSPLQIEPAELPQALQASITPQGWVRILPDMIADGVDGFFIARWQKHMRSAP